MKITSIEQYKAMQKERQKELDAIQTRKAARHMRKKAHDTVKLAKKQAEEIQMQLPIERVKDETSI